MRTSAMFLAAALFFTAAVLRLQAFATDPWPGNRWRADVDEVKAGPRLHATMLGLETNAAPGTITRVICTDMGLASGTTVRQSAIAHAQTRQDDWEGDAGVLGSFCLHTVRRSAGPVRRPAPPVR